jgi:hypothetical protein
MTCFAIVGLQELVSMTNEKLAVAFENPLTWFGLKLHYQDVFTLRFGLTFFLYGLAALMCEFVIGFITLVLDGYSSLGRVE